jgi:hypothetical protein
MRPDDAEALLAVYGDSETMQHLNTVLPANVDDARVWVQTKIDLFERDNQLSLWTIIHTESGQSAMSGFSTRITVPVRWWVWAAGVIESSGVEGSASKQPARPSLPDLISWISRPLVPKPGR